MGNIKKIWYAANEGDTEPPKGAILAALVAKNEPPEDIANFIVWEYLYNTPFYDYQTIIKKERLKEIIPSPLWDKITHYLAIFFALANFGGYMEMQFLMVCSCGQSYSVMKIAQYCEQEKTTGANDIFRLLSFSFPNATFTNCAEKAKGAAETFYKSIVNFKSAMFGAREWIKTKEGAADFVPLNFDAQEKQLKEFLPQWRAIFQDVNKIKYFRKERACFNFYKITGNNRKVIDFVTSMLENYYLSHSYYLKNG